MEITAQILFLALQSRLASGRTFTNRSAYVGASEIGTCLRHIVAAKLDPIPFDTASMGRMLAGRALENEVVQLVRIALNGSLRNTGRVQVDLKHPTLPFHAHPDGKIIGGTFEGLDGDGVLEVKTASASTFKRYQSDGLPQHYLDQVQSQMGLSGSSWALVVLVSRENLAEMATFTVRFDAKHYAGLEDRARIVAAHLEAHSLPSGEPDRGFCHQCPLAGQCAALQERREAGKRGDLPEVLRLQLDAQVEELVQIEAELEPMQARATVLRERIRQGLDISGATKISFDVATIQLVASSRTSFDSKALQRDSPDIYGRFLKTSTFTTMRFTRKGEQPCLSTAS